MEESKENEDWKGSKSKRQGQANGMPELDTVYEDEQENIRNLAGDHWKGPSDWDAPQNANQGADQTPQKSKSKTEFDT